ncbi:MAG: hypothetical protein BWX70_01566 [Verrucomicrobia bacterium ADurb.Bin070]|nr:MAG: hypothetical protein BWX70_01566 [Verrucomicrobia bacterium ADurb.Bin070]
MRRPWLECFPALPISAFLCYARCIMRGMFASWGTGFITGALVFGTFSWAVHAAELSVPAIATFSDDTLVEGAARVIGSRPLTVVLSGENRQRMFTLADLVSVEQLVEQAGMERPWTFKEAGRPEKVYLEGEYPLVNFLTRLTLVNGSVVTGHVISAALELKGPTGKRKIFLQRQIKGTKTETLNDLVYLRTLRMPAATIADGRSISGRIEGFGTVLSVTALDTARGHVLFAHVADGACFDFGTLLPGRYDLCVLTDTHALAGLSDSVPPEADRGAPLQEGDPAAIDVKFPLADDFFNDRWILRLGGNRACAKALVYKRRAEYYEAARWTPGGFLWHLEVWTWHFADPDWKVDRRHILIRHKQKGGERNRTLLLSERLGAVTPGTQLHLQANEAPDATWHTVRTLD